MYAAAGGVNQHGGRAIHDISRSDLFVAGLQEIFFGDRRADGRHAAINRENRTDRDVNVDVRRAIQRVHQHHIFRVFAAFKDDNFVLFFRCDARYNIARF